MTIQEKIDKLPLSIEYNRKTYVLRFGGKSDTFLLNTLIQTCSGIIEVFLRCIMKI